MKVLVFTSLYPNNIWPLHGVFVKERMTHVARREGCEVRVIAPIPYFPPLKVSWRWRYSQVYREHEIEGVRVYHPRYFMIPKVSMALQGLLMFLCVFGFARRLRREFEFDLIDTHYVYPDGFAAALLGWALNKPVVASARGSDINLYSQFATIRRLLQFVLRRAARVIAVSTALKQAMVNLGVDADKILVVPNAVDKIKFFPVPKHEARRKLGLPEGKVVLSVGHLVPVKGFEVLIEAFTMLVARLPNEKLHLVLVGDGILREKLERMVSQAGLRDRVRLCGDVAHEQLAAWYSAADVFCLASRREGWPNVLLESLACGTPVVATRVGGVPEIITSSEVGLLSGASHSEVAETLAAALARSWNPEHILRHAEGYTWFTVAKTLCDVFQSVIIEATASRSPGAPPGKRQPAPKGGYGLS